MDNVDLKFEKLPIEYGAQLKEKLGKVRGVLASDVSVSLLSEYENVREEFSKSLDENINRFLIDFDNSPEQAAGRLNDELDVILLQIEDSEKIINEAKILFEKEKINELVINLTKLSDNLKLSGESLLKSKKPEDKEKFLLGQSLLLQELHKLSLFRTKFILDDGKNAILRANIFDQLSGAKSVGYFEIKSGINEKLELDKIEISPSIDLQLIESSISRVDYLLNIHRREIYLSTGDEKYREYYEKTQKDYNLELKYQSEKVVLDEAKDEESYQDVEFVMDLVIDTYTRLDGEMVEDPNKAIVTSRALDVMLNAIRENGQLSTFDKRLANINKKPALKARLREFADNYEKLNSVSAIRILAQNKDVLKLYDDFQFAVNEKGVIGGQLKYLRMNIENMLSRKMQTQDWDLLSDVKEWAGFSDDAPSKEAMKMIHASARNLLHSNHFQKIKDSNGYNFIKNLKLLPENSEYAREHNKMVKELKSVLENIDDFEKNIKSISGSILDMDGSDSGWAPIGKEIAIIAGGVVVGMGAGLLFKGAATAYKIGEMARAARIVFAAAEVAGTSLATTVGTSAVYSAFEGNLEAFESDVFLRNWGYSALTMGAARIATPYVGNFMAKATERASKSKFVPAVLRKQFANHINHYAAKALLNPRNFELGAKGFVRQFTLEFGEELAEEGMESFGRAISANNPVLGFMFMLIPSATRHSRIKLGMNKVGSMIESGTPINVTYPNLETALSEVSNLNAPMEVITQLRETGSLNLEQNGIKINVIIQSSEVNKAAPAVEAQLENLVKDPARFREVLVSNLETIELGSFQKAMELMDANGIKLSEKDWLPVLDNKNIQKLALEPGNIEKLKDLIRNKLPESVRVNALRGLDNLVDMMKGKPGKVAGLVGVFLLTSFIGMPSAYAHWLITTGKVALGLGAAWAGLEYWPITLASWAAYFAPHIPTLNRGKINRLRTLMSDKAVNRFDNFLTSNTVRSDLRAKLQAVIATGTEPNTTNAKSFLTRLDQMDNNFREVVKRRSIALIMQGVSYKMAFPDKEFNKITQRYNEKLNLLPSYYNSLSNPSFRLDTTDIDLNDDDNNTEYPKKNLRYDGLMPKGLWNNIRGALPAAIPILVSLTIGVFSGEEEKEEEDQSSEQQEDTDGEIDQYEEDNAAEAARDHGSSLPRKVREKPRVQPRPINEGSSGPGSNGSGQPSTDPNAGIGEGSRDILTK